MSAAKRSVTCTPCAPEFKAVRADFRAALKVEDFSRAAELVDQLTSRWPDNSFGLEAKCVLANKTQTSLGAVKTIRQVQELLPENVVIATYLTNALNSVGNTGESRSLITRLLAKHPDDTRLNNSLTRIYQSSDDWLVAKERWKEQLSDTPDDTTSLRGVLACYQHLGELPAVVACLDRLIANGKDSPMDHYNRSRAIARISRLSLSVEESAQFANLYPADIPIQIAHARALGTNRGRGEAIKFLKQKITQFSEPGTAMLLTLASLYESSRNFEKAIEWCIKCRELAPNNVGISLRLARLYSRQGESDQALELLQSLDNGETCDLLPAAIALVHKDMDNRLETMSYAINAIRVRDNITNYSLLCKTLISANRRKFAHLAVKSFAGRHGQVPRAWNDLGLRLAELKRFREAVYWRSKFFEASPSDYAGLDNHARALWQIGETEKSWNAKLACSTNNPVFLYGSAQDQQNTLDQIKESVKHCASTMSVTSDSSEFIDSVQQIRALVPRPAQLKIQILKDERTTEFLCQLAELEKNPNKSKLANFSMSQLDEIISNNACVKTAGDLLYRCATVFERAEHPWDALRLLERAAHCHKKDDSILSKYRQVLKNNSTCITYSGAHKSAVLMVTCAANQERANKLAQHILAESGNAVITVSANTDSSQYTLQPTKYGYKLVVPCSDDYLALPEKLLLAYRYLLCSTNCAGVLKIDDDVIMQDADAFNEMLNLCQQDSGGYVGHVTTFSNSIYHHGRHQSIDGPVTQVSHDPVNYCTGGGGYYLSRKNLNIIFEYGIRFFDVKTRPALYEDVYFAEILSRAGVTPTDVSLSDVGGYLIDVFEPLCLLGAELTEPLGALSKS